MKSELGIMIQSPFEEFEEWIQKIAENRLPELRKGQFIYNMAYTEFPDQVDLLGYCGIDCFQIISSDDMFCANASCMLWA